MVSVGSWKNTALTGLNDCAGKCLLLCSGSRPRGSISQVLGAFITALLGRARQLPSGSKVALEVLLGYTGCGEAAQNWERFSPTAEHSALFTRQK